MTFGSYQSGFRDFIGHFLRLVALQNQVFSPCRGDYLHRFTSNLAWPTGTWVRLAVQNLTSIGAGVGMRPQNFDIVKHLSRPGNPMIVVFLTPSIDIQFQGNLFGWGAKYTGREKFAIFD